MKSGKVAKLVAQMDRAQARAKRKERKQNRKLKGE